MQPELMKWIFIILKAQLYKYVLFGFISLVLILVFTSTVFLSISSLQCILKDCCQTWNFCPVYLNLLPKDKSSWTLQPGIPLQEPVHRDYFSGSQGLTEKARWWGLVSSPTPSIYWLTIWQATQTQFPYLYESDYKWGHLPNLKVWGLF